MSSKSLLLIFLLAVLAAIYAFSSSGWFEDEQLKILVMPRSGTRPRPADPYETPVYPISISFAQKHRLKYLKVVRADDLATNKYPAALWHLIGDPRSEPVKAILYGHDVPGMRSAISNREPFSLEPHVQYTVLIETASGLEGRKNFEARQITRR